MTTSIIIKITCVISMWTPHWITVSCHGVEGPMTSGYYCANFSILWRRKKKKTKNKGILWLGYHRYPCKKTRNKMQTVAQLLKISVRIFRGAERDWDWHVAKSGTWKKSSYSYLWVHNLYFTFHQSHASDFRYWRFLAEGNAKTIQFIWRDTFLILVTWHSLLWPRLEPVKGNVH